MNVNLDITSAIGILFKYQNPEGRESVRQHFLDIAMDLKDYQSDVLLTVTMPCGESKEYKTVGDIPLVDDPCSCGDMTHWFVKYEEF